MSTNDLPSRNNSREPLIFDNENQELVENTQATLFCNQELSRIGYGMVN